jgi:uncharacterized protein YegJ (DUF2314 family)
MSTENRFFNFHLKPDCRNNSKIGFQSLDSDVQALQKGLKFVRERLIASGKLKDTDTLQIWAKYTETDAAEELVLDELTFADGTTVKVDNPPVTVDEDEAEAEAEEKPDIPF